MIVHVYKLHLHHDSWGVFLFSSILCIVYVDFPSHFTEDHHFDMQKNY